MSVLKVHGPEGEHKAVKGTSCKTLGSGGDCGEMKTSLLLERGHPLLTLAAVNTRKCVWNGANVSREVGKPHFVMSWL